MTATRHHPSLPYAPLERLAASGPLHNPAGCEWCGHDDEPGRCVTVRDLSERLGCGERQIFRWRNSGRIRATDGDREAVAIGMHPINVWGELWEAQQ